MGKVKDLVLSWLEDYESNIKLEFTKNGGTNWFDAKEPPRFGDNKWYRRKVEKNNHQSDDNYLPK